MMSADRIFQRGDIVSITPHGDAKSRLGLVVSTPDYYEATMCIQAALISTETEGVKYGYAVLLTIRSLGHVISDDVKKISAKRHRIEFVETSQPSEIASVLGKINTLFT
jgi:hypothetical protein